MRGEFYAPLSSKVPRAPVPLLSAASDGRCASLQPGFHPSLSPVAVVDCKYSSADCGEEERPVRETTCTVAANDFLVSIFTIWTLPQG